MDWKSLTFGEKLLLSRSRLGLSQEEYSMKYKMHRNTYGRIERGDLWPMKNMKTPKSLTLLDREICMIKRRRVGKSQADCADEMGITRFWYNRMELGQVPDTALIEYWG